MTSTMYCGALGTDSPRNLEGLDHWVFDDPEWIRMLHDRSVEGAIMFFGMFPGT